MAKLVTAFSLLLIGALADDYNCTLRQFKDGAGVFNPEIYVWEPTPFNDPIVEANFKSVCPFMDEKAPMCCVADQV